MTSFCQHLHDMRVFWQLHQTSTRYGWNKIRDMPAMQDIQLQRNAGGVNRFFNSSGKSIVVPIWKIPLSRGIQN
jgi:hypothetical protein